MTRNWLALAFPLLLLLLCPDIAQARPRPGLNLFSSLIPWPFSSSAQDLPPQDLVLSLHLPPGYTIDNTTKGDVYHKSGDSYYHDDFFHYSIHVMPAGSDGRRVDAFEAADMTQVSAQEGQQSKSHESEPLETSPFVFQHKSGINPTDDPSLVARIRIGRNVHTSIDLVKQQLEGVPIAADATSQVPWVIESLKRMKDKKWIPEKEKNMTEKEEEWKRDFKISRFIHVQTVRYGWDSIKRMQHKEAMMNEDLKQRMRAQIADLDKTGGVARPKLS